MHFPEDNCLSHCSWKRKTWCFSHGCALNWLLTTWLAGKRVNAVLCYWQLCSPSSGLQPTSWHFCVRKQIPNQLQTNLNPSTHHTSLVLLSWCCWVPLRMCSRGGAALESNQAADMMHMTAFAQITLFANGWLGLSQVQRKKLVTCLILYFYVWGRSWVQPGQTWEHNFLLASRRIRELQGLG